MANQEAYFFATLKRLSHYALAILKNKATTALFAGHGRSLIISSTTIPRVGCTGYIAAPRHYVIGGIGNLINKATKVSDKLNIAS